METLEAITTRRSVRRFVPDPVPDEAIHELLTAGMSGPSAGNQQPWRFIVLRGQEQLGLLAGEPVYRRVLSTATLAIVVCGDMELSKYGENWIIDCAIATQNMLLAAHSLGLGSVWLSCHYMDERVRVVNEALAIPEHLKPFAIVPIGWPEQAPAVVERFDAQRVHEGGWRVG